MALGTRAPERFKSAFDKPMDSTKAGITKSLTVAYDYCIDGLKQMNDADLLKMGVIAGRSESKLDIFWGPTPKRLMGLARPTFIYFSRASRPRTQGRVTSSDLLAAAAGNHDVIKIIRTANTLPTRICLDRKDLMGAKLPRQFKLPKSRHLVNLGSDFRSSSCPVTNVRAAGYSAT